jgi:threonylcarbamoyladenosine tRNA methylthiotransferase MtaB
MTKVSFFTLGCRVNQTETAVLEDVFRQKGFQLVDGETAMDIAVINSCTVTGESDHEALRIIKRVRQLNNDVRVAVIGCQAEVQKEDVLAMANVRWVVGSARKMHLADIILEDPDVLKRLVVPTIRRTAFTMPLVNVKGRRTRAYLKVQDGCDNFCAYCEVPFARGRARSRVFDDVMAAGEALVDAGHQEIVLTGINIGLYQDQTRTLVDVIKGLEKMKALKRIRLSSVEYAPWIMDLAGLMKPPHKLCRFLHIPVQSGCDAVLRRMGRRYVCADMASLLRKLSAKVPGLLLGTDVIAGFPGETDRDFEQTCGFLREQPFHYFHVFSYSDRRRARSRSFKGSVSPEVVRARSRQLREISQAKHREFLSSLPGSTAEVLFEHKKDEDWIGHTDNYVTIKTRSNRDLHNIIIPVQITGIQTDTAIGKI